jgi:hypothetical protein
MIYLGVGRQFADRMTIQRQSCGRKLTREAAPQSCFTPIVEKWRELADGQIELAIRHYPTAD